MAANIDKLAVSLAGSVRKLAVGAGQHWRGVIAVATFSAAAAHLLYIILLGKFGWDFAVYRAGIATHRAASNPCDAHYLLTHYGVELPVIYPPVIVLLSQLSWLLNSPIAHGLLLIVHVAAFVAIPTLLVSRSRTGDFSCGLAVAIVSFVVAVSLVKTPLADWSALMALLGVWLGTGVEWLQKTEAAAIAAKPAILRTVEPVR